MIIAASDASNVGIVVAAVVLGLAQLILWIVAAVSIVRNDRLTGGGKLLWFVVIIAFPFLGCLGWFLFGRNAALVKTPLAT
jgi:hypothetical protein